MFTDLFGKLRVPLSQPSTPPPATAFMCQTDHYPSGTSLKFADFSINPKATITISWYNDEKTNHRHFSLLYPEDQAAKVDHLIKETTFKCGGDLTVRRFIAALKQAASHDDDFSFSKRSADNIESLLKASGATEFKWDLEGEGDRNFTQSYLPRRGYVPTMGARDGGRRGIASSRRGSN